MTMEPWEKLVGVGPVVFNYLLKLSRVMVRGFFWGGGWGLWDLITGFVSLQNISC